ncbi:MAG: hypothetical protein R3E90_14840 [Marinicella sp.]|nr:hypothetical protein [Xanthomonadales bacterium]
MVIEEKNKMKNFNENQILTLNKFHENIGVPSRSIIKKPFSLFKRPPIKINVYEDYPEKNMVSYITSGVSLYEFFVPEINATIRQELILTLGIKWKDFKFEELLYGVFYAMKKDNKPIYPQEVIDISANKLVDGLPKEYHNFVADSGVWFSPDSLILNNNGVETIFVELLMVNEELGDLSLQNYQQFKKQYYLLE